MGILHPVELIRLSKLNAKERHSYECRSFLLILLLKHHRRRSTCKCKTFICIK